MRPRATRDLRGADARAATRRDAFLLALCASKKLSYPDRSEYAALETTAMREVTRSMESDGSFLTWLPEQCWQGGVPPPPMPEYVRVREVPPPPMMMGMQPPAHMPPVMMPPPPPVMMPPPLVQVPPPPPR